MLFCPRQGRAGRPQHWRCEGAGLSGKGAEATEPAKRKAATSGAHVLLAPWEFGPWALGFRMVGFGVLTFLGKLPKGALRLCVRRATPARANAFQRTSRPCRRSSFQMASLRFVPLAGLCALLSGYRLDVMEQAIVGCPHVLACRLPSPRLRPPSPTCGERGAGRSV